MDGYTIAKSVQELADERERMMADMDKKNRDIQELVDRNTLLRQQLQVLGYQPDEYVGNKLGVTDPRGPEVTFRTTQKLEL